MIIRFRTVEKLFHIDDVRNAGIENHQNHDALDAVVQPEPIGTLLHLLAISGVFEIPAACDNKMAAMG